MTLTPWLRAALAPRTPRKPPAARRPAVESLEDRTCPSSGGLLDPTFGSGGVVTSPFSDDYAKATDVLVQPDGKVVAAGALHNRNSNTGVDFLVARYNPDGTLDGGFGTGGRTFTDFGSRGTNVLDDWGGAVALQPGTGGKILVAGRSGLDFALARYNANGTLDTTFGSGGRVVTDVANRQSGRKGDRNLDSLADAMAVQPDGRIMLAGFVDTSLGRYFALVRYNPNGTLDATFGSGGKVVTDIRASAPGISDTHSLAVALQPDGSIVLAGSTDRSTPLGVTFVVARFNPNGTPDAGFGSGGRVVTDFAGGDDRALGVAIQSDGKIVAVGITDFVDSQQLAVARYNTNGSLDLGFGQQGRVTTAVGTWDWANDVVVQPNGKILVGGWVNSYGEPANDYMVLVRYNPDGSLDTSYGAAGTGVVLTLIGTGARASALALQPDGKAILAGLSTAPGVPTSLALARFLPSAPQVGSFTASPNPVTAGSSVTLTASGITDGNPNSTVNQVTFYADSNGDGRLEAAADARLGDGTRNADGTWTLTVSTAGWAPGSYTVFVQVTDSFGALGDPLSTAVQLM